MAVFTAYLGWTHSWSFGTIRNIIVDKIVDWRTGGMARTANRLTALKVEKASRPGMYADGGGLYLRVTNEGTKNWVYRFMLNGRPRWMGIGPVALYSLQEARGKALDASRQRHSGIDPIEARRAARTQERLEAAKAITFKQCAATYIKAHGAGWRNIKHAGQWEATLKTYAEPIFGALPVQAIDTSLVMKVLEQDVGDGPDKNGSPLWTAKPETASRLRGRMEAILDWARVRGYRSGENPARWRGHLDKLLPARAKVRKVKHHAALPFADLPDFLAALRAQEGTAARALEFAILTAARTGEVIGATWEEINWQEKIWGIGGTRMKAGKEHRVPLCDRALAILKDLKPAEDARDNANHFVFAGAKASLPLSNMALLMLLRRMKRDDLTAHGFRSTFRDWAAERTNFPGEVVEMALAHAVGSKVEAAYRRGDLFEKRRRLMDAWSQFCATAPSKKDNIVSLRSV
jgi:integrase